MSKLSDIKAVLGQVEALGLPVSEEQKQALKMAEENYVRTDIIPKIKESIKELFGDIEHKVRIIIDYDGNPDIAPKVYRESSSVDSAENNSGSSENEEKEKVQYTSLRVTYPDGKTIEDRGLDVLLAVVKEVGPDLVHEMNIKCCGLPLVDDHKSNGPYGKDQRELPGGYWIIVNTNNKRKKKQIDAISKELGLGLKVEVLDPENEVVVDSHKTTRTNPRNSRVNIKVTTPDGKVFFNDVVWETLKDVVLYAGSDHVRSLGQKYVGIPLVDDHITQGIYAKQQHEIEPGVFLNTYSDTRTKVKQIKEISDRLQLNLKVEII